MNSRIKVYVSSRASITARPHMWRRYRDMGANINSTWIDEADDQTTVDYVDLWTRIHKEILACQRFVLYADESDFPLKGALVEVGMAITLNRPVWVLGHNLDLQMPTYRPLGSWIKHPGVEFVQPRATLTDMMRALGLHK